jgi:hypothetical protein
VAVATVAEECDIALWRGYVKSEFTAVRRSDGVVVARSRAFGWRRDADPPREEPYASAHAELVRALGEEGWADSGRGEAWYALAFTREAGARRAE